GPSGTRGLSVSVTGDRPSITVDDDQRRLRDLITEEVTRLLLPMSQLSLRSPTEQLIQREDPLDLGVSNITTPRPRESVIDRPDRNPSPPSQTSYPPIPDRYHQQERPAEIERS